MELAILKSDNLGGMEIDALGPSLKAEGDTTTEPKMRAVVDVYTTAATAVKAVTANPGLTPLGQQDEAKKTIAEAKSALKRFEAEADRLGSVAKATRAQALQSTATERTVETLMLEREIRDRLVGKNDLEVNAVYQSALAREDWATVEAIERAPLAFPLITEEMRAQGDDARLSKSPLAAHVAAQETAHRRFSGIVATTRSQLALLAQEHGLTFEE